MRQSINAIGHLRETRRDVQTFVFHLTVVRLFLSIESRLAGENVSEMT